MSIPRRTLHALSVDSTGISRALTAASTATDGAARSRDSGRVTTVALLETDSVQVEAGQYAALPLNVSNTGDVVEDYVLDIVGVPAAWATVEPARFTLYPGTSQTAMVHLRPPRSSQVPAGEQRFGVHVVPTEHPELAVVPEAVVEVLPFLETTAELVPRISHGRFGGKHQVAVDNRGNVPVTVILKPHVESDALTVRAEPESLTIDPGTATFADVRVKPTSRLWRGTPTTLPFAVIVAPQDTPEVRLEAGYVQDPILPAWLPKALLAALALALLLAGAWFFLLKPSIASAAREAIEEPLQEINVKVAAAEKAADSAGAAQNDAAKSAEQAQKSAGGGAKKNGTSASGNTGNKASGNSTSGKTASGNKSAGGTTSGTGGSGGSNTARLVTAPTSDRLSTETTQGNTSTDVFPIADGQTLSLTDFVLENTQGDSGILRITLGDRVVLTQALESFRTTDYHFVTPFVAQGPAQLVLEVTCNRPGSPPDMTPAPTSCVNAVTFGGELRAPEPAAN